MMKKPQLHSLAARLLLASLIILPLFAFISGVMLDRAFQQNLRISEAEKLRTQLYILLGASEWLDDQLWLPEQLAEPRFAAINSGLYAWVTNNGGDILWQSPSSKLVNFDQSQTNPLLSTGREQFRDIKRNTEGYFYYHYDLIWETDDGSDIPLRYTLWQDKTNYLASLKRYRTLLWEWLGALTLFLLISLVLIMRWGLAPLKKLAKDLQKIEAGQQDQLPGHYPDEIQPVTDSLNQLLKSERQQRDRYRNTLGDLAHSLKTPLAVVRGSLPQLQQQPELKQQLDEQVERMDSIVRHQLQRAVQHSQSSFAQDSIQVAPIAERLRNTLNKVYRDKGIECDINIADDTLFYGSAQDLMEVMGNLMENAYKYGSTKVQIDSHSSNEQLQIAIADNGQGIAPEQRQTILQRGQRADTATPGQGIGLAVAVDIISSYNGELSVDKAALGGALFTINLPLPS